MQRSGTKRKKRTAKIVVDPAPPGAGSVKVYGFLLAGVLALAGFIIILDASLADTASGYRLLAWCLALALILPLASLILLPARAPRFWKKASLAALPAIVLLGLGEISLRLMGYAGQAFALTADPELGHRLADRSPEADSWGFRNPRVPERSDVVFIGDSQVYGFGVDQEESLPAQFADLSGVSSYSMSLGGYGPVQYLELCKRALQLKPKLLVLGLYLGNDILDAHLYAGLESASSYRNPSITYGPYQAVELRGKVAPNLAMAIVDGLRSYSVIVEASVDLVRNLLSRQSDLAELYSMEPDAPRHAEGNIATLFTPTYRMAASNLDDERVLDGIRITSLCLQDIAMLCKEANVPVMLLVIPSKESAYAAMYEQTEVSVPALEQLSAAEAMITEQLLVVAAESGFLLLDSRPALTTALSADEPIWPAGADGHPRAEGYSMLAALVLQAWRQSGWQGPR